MTKTDTSSTTNSNDPKYAVPAAIPKDSALLRCSTCGNSTRVWLDKCKACGSPERNWYEDHIQQLEKQLASEEKINRDYVDTLNLYLARARADEAMIDKLRCELRCSEISKEKLEERVRSQKASIVRKTKELDALKEELRQVKETPSSTEKNLVEFLEQIAKAVNMECRFYMDVVTEVENRQKELNKLKTDYRDLNEKKNYFCQLLERLVAVVDSKAGYGQCIKKIEEEWGTSMVDKLDIDFGVSPDAQCKLIQDKLNELISIVNRADND